MIRGQLQCAFGVAACLTRDNLKSRVIGLITVQSSHFMVKLDERQRIDSHLLSVLIPTLNRGSDLDFLLQQLQLEDPSVVRVVVSDNNSDESWHKPRSTDWGRVR